MSLNGMNFESKRQELARRLVDREIYYCVSSLVSTLSNLAQNCSPSVLRNECLYWEEDILPLLESTNYEEAVCAWVMDSSGTDVQSLESAIEIDNYFVPIAGRNLGHGIAVNVVDGERIELNNVVVGAHVNHASRASSEHNRGHES